MSGGILFSFMGEVKGCLYADKDNPGRHREANDSEESERVNC